MRTEVCTVHERPCLSTQQTINWKVQGWKDSHNLRKFLKEVKTEAKLERDLIYPECEVRTKQNGCDVHEN